MRIAQRKTFGDINRFRPCLPRKEDSRKRINHRLQHTLVTYDNTCFLSLFRIVLQQPPVYVLRLSLARRTGKDGDFFWEIGLFPVFCFLCPS